jgi:hypothetical protein
LLAPAFGAAGMWLIAVDQPPAEAILSKLRALPQFLR